MYRNTLTMDRYWIFVFALFFFSSSNLGWTVDLGDTRETILVRHGKPQREQPDGTISYEWGDWLLGIKFRDDKAFALVYGKMATLTDADIAGVFASSGGKDAWQKVDEKHWRRMDGNAIATLGTR